MKHTKSKEFLDTSLSKIKLNQILSFDMNVSFKPMYDSNLNRTKKQAKESQNNAVADRARQGSYTDSSVGEEKNKYIIFTNPIKSQQAASTLATNDSPAPSSTIDPTLPYDIAKTLNNDMINSISSFMEQNALLWEQVSTTLNQINTTSTNLEKKIQKAKN